MATVVLPEPPFSLPMTMTGLPPDTRASSSRFVERQQASIAARRRRVRRRDTFDREAMQIMRPAGLGAGARQTLAAERLHADDRADLIAVDVEVADLCPRLDEVGCLLDARVHAERQAVACRVDRLAD